MDKSSLKEYLKILIDMEQNILIQENVISEMQRHITEMKKTNEYIKPTEPDGTSKDVNPFVPLIMSAIGILIGIWAFNLLVSGSIFFGFLGGLLLIVIAAVLVIGGVGCCFSLFEA